MMGLLAALSSEKKKRDVAGGGEVMAANHDSVFRAKKKNSDQLPIE